MTTESDAARCLRCLETVPLLLMGRHVEDQHKHSTHPCPTWGCPGDGRYSAPGRGHAPGCVFPPDQKEV